MNILISSYAFYPSVGGLEEASHLLAEEFVARGHAVKVVTITHSAAPDIFAFDVIRRPTFRQLIRAVRWCDVYLQEQISLQLAWPLLLARRPWVVALQTHLDGGSGILGWKRRLKRAALRSARRIVACSDALARQIGEGATVIPNPYREKQFRRLAETKRIHDLVFLGRLVSDKGADLLIEALALLRERSIAASLVIIGGGPEEAALRARCQALGLMKQIHFAGIRRGDALVKLLNECRIMVIPSVWDEPFGIVALEGIASGCVVVAARAGGLPEAVGPCGLIFPKGDAAALSNRIADLLCDDAKIAALRAKAPEHLARHRPKAIAEAYLDILTRACVPPR